MKIDAHNHIGKKKGISVSVDDFINQVVAWRMEM